MFFAVCALALTGCADSGTDVYDGAQTQADTLPPEVPSEAYDFDPDSSRLLATHKGYQFFAVSSPSQGDCLLSYDPTAPQTWVAGCSTGNRIGTSGQVGITADYDPQGLPDTEAPDGWIRLTPQLQVSEG